MKSLYTKCLDKVEECYGHFSVRRRGFWFVDIPRTSSSSIRSELGVRFGRVYGKKNVIEKEYSISQIFLDHMTASKARELFGHSLWNQIFTFTVVRNPWDRILSLYHYRRKVLEIPGSWSFRDYVIELGKATQESEYFKYHGCRFGASDFILDKSGNLIVDYIVKYENRVDDLKVVAERLNINSFGNFEIQKAAPINTHYSSFYDSETKEIIRRLYAKDIEMFDYEY